MVVMGESRVQTPGRWRLCGVLCLALVALAQAACWEAPADRDEDRTEDLRDDDARNEDPRFSTVEDLVLRGQYEEVVTILEGLLEEHPGTGRAELLLGLSLHEQRLYSLALPHLERSLELAPFQRQEGAWYYLGWCRLELGRLEQAKEAFARHLELVPDEGDSHFGLGLVHLELDQLSEAARSFEKSIELNLAALSAGRSIPSSAIAKAHARLADVHLAEDDLAGARQRLQECLAIYPAAYAAWYKLYEVCTRLGEEEAAAAALTQHELWRARVRGTPEPSAEEEP